MVEVKIVYITNKKEIIELTCSLAENTTVAEALESSGIYQTHPETKSLPFGIFSKQVRPNYQLKSGDRIEIYRPLTLDPKEKRRLRASN